MIQHAVWLYYRFTMSYRDVEDLLAERGIDVSYETIRCWCRKFGPQIARNLRRLRPPPDSIWHLDEMVVSVAGKRMYLWRAVDAEGEVLDMLIQRRRNTAAALDLLKRLLKNQRVSPTAIVTDGLRSYGAALRELGLQHRHRPGRLQENNRAENSHLPDPTTRTKDAGVQINWLRPALSRHTRRRLQHLLHSATPDFPQHAADAAGAGGACLDDRYRDGVSPRGGGLIISLRLN